MTVAHFDDFFERLALPPEDRGRISERSWYEGIETIRKKRYDLKAFNPNAPDNTDKRTPEDLIAIIRQAQREIDEALQALERGGVRI